MCVIIAGRKAKPDLEKLSACARANPDGAGIAWTTESGVRWRKGLEPRDVAKVLEREVRGAWIIHFRYATVGGSCSELTHPFSVDARVSTDAEGEAERVLFHNGHFGGWQAALREAVLSADVRLPGGEWSDSRAIAMLAHLKGEGILNVLPGKYAVLERDGFQLYPRDRSTWSQQGKLWFSNLNWQARQGLGLFQK